MKYAALDYQARVFLRACFLFSPFFSRTSIFCAAFGSRSFVSPSRAPSLSASTLRWFPFLLLTIMKKLATRRKPPQVNYSESVNTCEVTTSVKSQEFDPLIDALMKGFSRLVPVRSKDARARERGRQLRALTLSRERSMQREIFTSWMLCFIKMYSIQLCLISFRLFFRVLGNIEKLEALIM